MDIKRKLEITERSIQSISGHVDADGAVRLAALDKIKAFCDAEAETIRAQVQEAVAATVG